MQDREAGVQTSLQAIANKAGSQPGYRFRNLYGMLNEAMLKDSWQYIRKDAAYGVDRVSAEDYEQNLDENIQKLVGDLKQKRYRAKLVRRRYIPKGNGKLRPLGIPATQDKLLQLAVKRILEAIYEQDFLRCSYGYRPNVGALDAVDKLTIKLQFGKYHYVVEADIQGFFDKLDHPWLLKMLAERVDDKALLWLVEKWLKAGVLDTDGRVLHPVTGTPQGGIVSPILANVYLYYALDLWFQKVVVPHCSGEVCLIRYADDFICAFEKQVDAQRFYEALGKRLGKFGLELSAEKTRIIPFSATIAPGKTSFGFLGFEFRWGKDRAGKPHVKRRTARKSLSKSLKSFNLWCKENRHLRLPELFKQLNAKLRGYYLYYGVHGNFVSLQRFFFRAVRLLMKHLNQRSQRKSYNWAGFRQLIEQFGIEKPRIVGHPNRTVRMSVAPGMA
jgi:group II intron reverse transcriptase/maturase